MKCDYCEEEKDDVTSVLDPFCLEINDEEVRVNLCNECYGNRSDEI